MFVSAFFCLFSVSFYVCIIFASPCCLLWCLLCSVSYLYLFVFLSPCLSHLYCLFILRLSPLFCLFILSESPFASFCLLLSPLVFFFVSFGCTFVSCLFICLCLLSSVSLSISVSSLLSLHLSLSLLFCLFILSLSPFVSFCFFRLYVSPALLSQSVCMNLNVQRSLSFLLLHLRRQICCSYLRCLCHPAASQKGDSSSSSSSRYKTVRQETQQKSQRQQGTEGYAKFTAAAAAAAVAATAAVAAAAVSLFAAAKETLPLSDAGEATAAANRLSPSASLHRVVSLLPAVSA